jgi:hypothetical protein
MRHMKTRWIRVGDTDVKIAQWHEFAADNLKEPTRTWFAGPDGVETNTYYEMLDKLGGRPKPFLPEDEHRPSARTTQDVSQPAGDSLPGAGMAGIVEDALDSLSGSPAVERVAAGKPRTERNDYPKSLGAYPWTLDTRSIDEISEEEMSMQIIWHAEQLRESQPDLYDAALDSVKRQEYLDKLQRCQLEAADAAPRCHFIKSDGEPCRAPALKKRRYCHFHNLTSSERQKKEGLTLPVLEDDLSVQMAVTSVCRGLADGNIEPKRAATLLYGLQVATSALRVQLFRLGRERSEPQDVAF